MSSKLQDQLLRERFELLHKLVGKPVVVKLPHYPGHRRIAYAWRVFGYSSALGPTYDPSKIGPGCAIGLMLTDFNERGEPFPEAHARCLVVFDYSGSAIANVTPVVFHE